MESNASWMTELMAALGVTGSGAIARIFYKQNQREAEFEQRHKASEARLTRHSEAIKALGDSSARTETTIENLRGDIDEIKDGIRVLVNNAAGRDVV
tara:strand:- start:3549 stop:3839 length:291 start_codon:yes stop_codon:yes gene_type:complete